MPNKVKSVDTGNNSTCSAPATLARKSATSFDRLTKAELIEKTPEFMSFLPKIGGLASFYTYIN